MSLLWYEKSLWKCPRCGNITIKSRLCDDKEIVILRCEICNAFMMRESMWYDKESRDDWWSNQQK